MPAPAAAAAAARIASMTGLRGWLSRFFGKQGLRQLGNPEFLGSNIGASALFMAPWMLMGSSPGESSSPDQQELYRMLADLESRGGMSRGPVNLYGR